MSIRWINLPKFIQELSVWDLNPVLFEGKVCIFNITCMFSQKAGTKKVGNLTEC